MSNLLAIDFDSFFPNPWGSPTEDKNGRRDMMLYDWGHSETRFMQEMIWPTRAEGFVMNKQPLPDLDGREIGFWDRFRIRRGAWLFYADSNACAVDTRVTGRRRYWNEVWLYDAHHDSGYNHEDPYKLLSAGLWSCENWMVLYRGLHATLHVRYPKWRAWAMTGEPTPIVAVDRQVDDGSAPDVEFDRIFVCRSSAWVPPWLDIDARFEQFVAAAPVWPSRRIDVEPGGLQRRKYNQADVERDVVIHMQMLRDTMPQKA